MEHRSNKYRNYVLSVLQNAENLIFADTETTGLKKDCQIIQFAGIHYILKKDSFSLKEYQILEQYIRPDEPISEKISEITGITNAFLDTCSYEKEVFHKIYDFLKGDWILVGYNFRFDMDKLEALYERNQKIFPHSLYIDVLEMARDVIPKGKISNYKLSTVAQYLECIDGLSAHSALDDTIMTKRVFEKLLVHYLESAIYEEEKEKVKLYYLYLWNNPHQKSMIRIICETSGGSVFYDTISKNWGIKTTEKRQIQDYDIDHLEKQCLYRYRVNDMEELYKILKNQKKDKKQKHAG